MVSPNLRLKAVLLDLDGTLVDTPHAIVDICQRTLGELGHPPADEALIRSTIGLPLPVCLATLLGIEPEDTGPAVDIYRVFWRAEVTPRLAQLLYPGVLEGLQRLSQRFKLGVVTGKAQEGADGTVDGARLRPFMSVVLGYTSVNNPKPAPDLALEAARRLGIDPAHCLVVGDSELDLKMATAAGMRSIGVTYGAQPEAALRAAHPTRLSHSFSEAVQIIEELATLPP